MVPIRLYIGARALNGQEPFGWALGYLFGDIPSFRLQAVLWCLDDWICLPTYKEHPSEPLGLADHLRIYVVGAANTRLLICAYCITVITAGIVIVMNLSSYAEVDTRRKVFHGMMVAMFGVTGFLDPSLVSLAFVLILAIFLLLDLFRASQLPPISKPLTMFLTPYVDGRDFKGPVVVSHLFLLTGCAVPFWLGLAGLERSGEGALAGWEVPQRELSMMTGVVCVGMGDAAASLVGRRFGRRKWIWGGGKSLEGSLAFAVAVTFGLLLARIYLMVGGWPMASHSRFLVATLKIVVASCATSLTEAVLTGANDNVLVPIILWIWVKALGI
jgi:dolichol kinase